MSDSYYVRVRGKVLGPFSPKQLAALRDRGQFRSFHEVSPDRAGWQPASSLPGFFVEVPSQAAIASDNVGVPIGPSPVETNSRTSVEEWLYVNAQGQEVGPLTRGQLQGLFQEGTIGDNTQVWRRDLDKWMTLAEVGLAKRGGGQNVGFQSTLMSGAIKLFFANPIAGLPQLIERSSPAAGAAWGSLFYVVFLIMILISFMLSGVVHKTQVFQTFQDVANSPGRFEIIAKLVLLAFLPLVSLWATISGLRLITRSHGHVGGDGLIAGAAFLAPGLVLPILVVFWGVSFEVVVFLVYLIVTLQVLQFHAAFSQTLRLPDQGIIFAIPTTFLLNAWLLKTMVQVLFRIEPVPWRF